MANFNQWNGLGNLTRDPEVRYAANGTAVCGFSLAINHSYKTATGEKKDEVLFMECTAFGKTAETLAQYTKKGRSLLVTGRLKSNEWEDKQTGAKRSKIGCVVDSFQFIGSAPSDSVDGQPEGHKSPIEKADMPARPSSKANAESKVPADCDDDDVPF